MAKKLQKWLAMCLVVCMCMSMFTIPAAATEQTTNCGKTAHEHGEACYTAVLKCEVTQDLTCVTPVHEHDSDCYHVHSTTAGCYAVNCKEQYDCEKQYDCTEEHEHVADCAAHVHGDACTKHTHIDTCYASEPSCEIDTVNPRCGKDAHTHGEGCYVPHVHGKDCSESKLTCTVEAHTHDESCVVQTQSGDQTIDQTPALMTLGLDETQPSAQSVEPITGTITENMTWDNGAVIGGVTISGNVTITVNGTVTVAGTIKLSPDAISNVTFNGENGAKLIRASDFTGQMFYAEGVSGNFQNLTVKNITLDGGAKWTGDVDKTLNRGTTNSGVKATGSVLYLVYANATLNNSTLQNHDDYVGETGNAVFLRYYSTIEFNNSVVKNNNSVSTYYSGGVITVRQGGTARTYNSEIYGNSGPQGGFFGISSTGSFNGIAEVYDSTFHHNYSDAGAVFDMQCNSNVGYLKIDGCEFYENASKRGLIYEHAYSRPVIIKDSYFHDNECAVWDCHADPILDLSGKIVVEEDEDYTKFLYETPIGVGGKLADDTVFPISDASYSKLMTDKKHLMTEVPTDNYYNPTSKYTIVASDMEKLDWDNTENLVFVKTDVDGNAMLDVVPVPNGTTTNVNLYENFKMGATDESNRLEVQAVSDEAKNVPVAVWFHEGFYFTGWAESANGAVKYSNASNASTYAEDTNLYANWKLQALELKMGRTDTSDPYCNTLQVTVSNKNTNGEITYSYQWYKGGVAIEGATSDEYTITETANYKCVVTASAEGFASVSAEKSGNATYNRLYVAQIVGGEKYETLAEAVAVANTMESATIKLLKDVYQSEGLTITGNVTIIGDHTIYRDADAVVAYTNGDHANTNYVPGDKAYYWDMFTVDAGATLTLDDGIVLDGNNNWTLVEQSPEDLAAEKAKTGWYAVYMPVSEEGKPGAGGGAYMIQNNGTLNVLDATLQNHYGNADWGKGWNGAINVGNNSVTTLDGATIKYIATNDGGSAVFMQQGNNAVLNIKGDTLITDIYGADNGSVIRGYDYDTVNMSGGTISNCRSERAGNVIMMYNSTMNMSGGEISGNIATDGMAVYLHSAGQFNMSGTAKIENNILGSGALYVRSIADSVTIQDKITLAYNTVNGTFDDVFVSSSKNEAVSIRGGIYTEDVDKWCDPGYVCIPYDETARTDDFIVVPGYKISYYTVDGSEEVTNPETNQTETKYTTTWVYDDFVFIPADKTAAEVDLFATPYRHVNSEKTQMIKQWYTDEAKTQAFDYSKEITENINLYGTWVDANFVAEINGVYYGSIREAVENAKTGDTVKVLKDHKIDVSELTENSVVYIDGRKIENLTIDFNGKTVTANTGDNTSGNLWTIFYARYGANVTFTGDGNVNIVGDDANRPYLFWASASTITVEDGTYIMDGSQTKGAEMGAVSHTFYASSRGHIYVKNGYYGNNDSKQDLMNIYDGSGSTITVTGGTYTEYFPDTNQPWEVTVPDQYTIVDNGNGTWSVSPYITVTFADKTMVVGNRVPELTYTIDYNYLGKEVVGVNVVATAISNPAVGNHTITGTVTLTDGTGDADNYAVKVVNGTLTVKENPNPGSGYRPSGSRPSNRPSTVVIEDELVPLAGGPQWLNTTDHYAYLVGFGDGTLRPYDGITRGQVATIFFRLLTDEAREEFWSETNNFTDCGEDLWCNTAISTLSNMGIISGYEDGTFRPNVKVTRAQFAKIMVGFFGVDQLGYFGLFSDVAEGAWHSQYVETANRLGLIQGYSDGTFKPNANITRAQACVIVNRALVRVPDEEHLLPLDEMLTWTDNTPDDWFYADMMEATSSHDYMWLETETDTMEQWTEKLAQPDWAKLEKVWSETYGG